EQLGGGRGLDRDALTDRAKQDEVVRTCAGVVVDDEVAFHHEHRYRLMRGERKLDAGAAGQTCVVDVDGRKGLGGSLNAAVVACDDPHHASVVRERHATHVRV